MKSNVKHKYDTTLERDRQLSALMSLDASMAEDEWFKTAAAVSSSDSLLTCSDFITWSSSGSNFKNEEDARKKFMQSQKRRGIGIGTLFHIAKEHGWSDDSRPIHEPTKHVSLIKANQPMTINKAKSAWDPLHAANENQAYLKRKLINPDGLRETETGDLVVPVYGLDGSIATLQTIDANSKKFMGGVSIPKDACFVVGERLQHASEAYICEGIGQASSVNRASGKTAVCCFGVGRMSGVTEAINAKYPDLKLVIVADVGKENQCAEIARAVSGGWVEMPADLGNNGDVNDLELRDGLSAVVEVLNTVKHYPVRFKLLTANELSTLPQVGWRLKNIMPKVGIGALFGPSTAGKSFMVIEMLARISRGDSFFGNRSHSCPVTYIAAEGAGGIANRIKAYQLVHGELPDNFRVITSNINILNPQDTHELTQTLCHAGHVNGVLVLDTLNVVCHGMDENSSADMGEAVSAIKYMQNSLGGMVMVVHHTGKDSARGLRGHSSLFAALDCAIEVSRDGERRSWINRKSRDGEDGNEHGFNLEVVEIGTDEDGDAITSCVIQLADDYQDSVSKIKTPSGENQRIVWKALGELLCKPSALYAKETPAELPLGRPAIKFDDALVQLHGCLPLEQAQSHRQNERIKKAISSLIDKNFIVFKSGWIWYA